MPCNLCEDRRAATAPVVFVRSAGLTAIRNSIMEILINCRRKKFIRTRVVI